MDCVVSEQNAKESVQNDLHDWFYNSIYVSFHSYWNIDVYGAVLTPVNVYVVFFVSTKSRGWILNISWDMCT